MMMIKTISDHSFRAYVNKYIFFLIPKVTYKVVVITLILLLREFKGLKLLSTPNKGRFIYTKPAFPTMLPTLCSV